jgi:hypothetical protein
MSFYKQLTELIQISKSFQKEVEDKELWFQEPYQSKYLNINKLLKLFEEQKIEIEGIAAAEQTTPVMDGFSSVRRAYYDLEKVVPPFLAGERKLFYYLQTYKIRCKFLLKMFTYSNFRGDWAKMRHVQDWLVEIYSNQEKYDAKGSIKQSLKDIKNLGDFEKLNTAGLQILQEEVENIHSLLAENSAIQAELSLEDNQLLQKGSQYLKDNEHLLQALPPIKDFEYEDAPVLETICYRCKQLVVLIDDFADNFEKRTEVTKLYDFKQALKDSFDLNIPICLDIHNAIVKAIGSHKSPSIKKLCKMIYKAVEPFANDDFLTKEYGDTVAINNADIEYGIPDTIEVELLLMTAIGELST